MLAEPVPECVQVLERGWLSSNNVLIADAAGAALVDSGYGSHAPQTLALVERALARVAAGLVEAGVGQLLVAGGETSGACVQALGVTQMQIGPQIDPGVPWCHAVSDVATDGLHLTLKSGNFGTEDFFTKAFTALSAGASV